MIYHIRLRIHANMPITQALHLYNAAMQLGHVMVTMEQYAAAEDAYDVALAAANVIGLGDLSEAARQQYRIAMKLQKGDANA